MASAIETQVLIDNKRRLDEVLARKAWAEIIGRHEFDLMTTVTFASPRFRSGECFGEAIRLGKMTGIGRAVWAAEPHQDRKSGLHLHGLVKFKPNGNRELFEAESRRLGLCKHEPVWSSTGAAGYAFKHVADGVADFYMFPERSEMWDFTVET